MRVCVPVSADACSSGVSSYCEQLLPATRVHHALMEQARRHMSTWSPACLCIKGLPAFACCQ